MLLFANLDQEAWLIEVSHVLTVSTREVFGDGHLSVVPHERGVGGSPLEIDVVHMVGALITPIRDDRATTKLQPDQLLELIVRGGIMFDIPDAVKAGCRRHELEDVVDSECASHLRLEGRSLEARPHLKANPLHKNRVIDVEKTRRTTKLLQAGLPERLLQNDVDQVLGHIIILVLEILRQVHLRLGLFVDRDLCCLPTIDRREH